nr:helix-turn-helix domain-containing protein [Streptomyces boncukensis]
MASGVAQDARLLTALFTFEQVAERFSVPESTLRYWVQARSIRHTRIGRHVRFSAEDLDAIIRDGVIEPQTSIARSA